MGEGSSIPRNAKPMPSLMLDGSSQIPAEAQDLKRKAMIRGELSYRPSFFTVVVFVTIAFLMLKCAVHLAAHRPKSVRFLAGGDNEQLIPLLADGSSGSDECDGEGSRGASGARPKEGRRNQRLGWKLWKTGTPTPKYKRQKDDDDSSPLQKPSTMKEPEQEDNDDSSRLPKPSTSKEPKDTSRRPPTFPLPKPSTSKEPEDASRRPPTFPQRGGRSRLTIKGMKVGDPGSSHYEEISLPFSHPLIGVGKVTIFFCAVASVCWLLRGWNDNSWSRMPDF